MKGLTILVLLGCCTFVLIKGILLSDSACYGTIPECDYYTLSCVSSKDAIRLQDLFVGYKPMNVCKPATHCNHSDTCCTKDPGDVSGRFNLKNTFDAYANCSGKHECVNVQAPWQLITGTQHTSTYVYMEYTCVQETDVLNFCGSTTDNSSVSKTNNSVEIKFDSRKQNTSNASRKDCRCSVTSTDGNPLNISMATIDVRLHSYVSRGNESQQYECSSSNITSHMYTGTCVNSTDHHDDNFRFNDTFVWDIAKESDIFLYDLYNRGKLDSPAMVWLSIKAVDSGRDITVTCNEVLPVVTSTVTTPSPTTSTSTAPPTSTEHVTSTVTQSTPLPDALSGDDDDDDNTTLYLAIFIPCFLLLVIICVIGLKCCQHRRRKKRLQDLNQRNASGTYRDAYILDKFIFDITQQDVNPNSPAVLGGETEANGEVHANPVYEPDDIRPVKGHNSIKTVSGVVQPPLFIGMNGANGEVRANPVYEPDDIRPVHGHNSIKTVSGVVQPPLFRGMNGAKGDVLINPVYESGDIATVHLPVSTQTSIGTVSVIEQPPVLTSNSLVRMGNSSKVPDEKRLSNTAIVSIKSNAGNNIDTDSRTNEIIQNKANEEILRTADKTPNSKESAYSDPILHTQTNTALTAENGNSVVTRMDKDKPELTKPVPLPGKHHEILRSPKGGVVIRIGTAPTPQNTKPKPSATVSGTPAVIVPETAEK